jgi:hypothetical protein
MILKKGKKDYVGSSKPKKERKNEMILAVY